MAENFVPPQVKTEDDNSDMNCDTQNPHCRQCELKHYSDVLAEQRLRMLEMDRARVTEELETLRENHESLRRKYEVSRGQGASYQIAFTKKATELQAEYQARLAVQQLWAGEKDMRARLENRLDQSLMTLRQFAAHFHFAMVNQSALSPAQKAELKKLEYAQVVLGRDELRAHCIELQNRLARPPAHVQPGPRTVVPTFTPRNVA